MVTKGKAKWAPVYPISVYLSYLLYKQTGNKCISCLSIRLTLGCLHLRGGGGGVGGCGGGFTKLNRCISICC